MSSYFDNFDRSIRESSNHHKDTESFLKDLISIEEQLKRDSLLFAGDVETPEDVRQTIVAIIALHEVRYKGGDFLGDELGESRGAQHAAACRNSLLCKELHSLWHDIAAQGYEFRYGAVRDNPAHAVKLRDAYSENPKPKDRIWSNKRIKPFKSAHLDAFRKKKP